MPNADSYCTRPRQTSLVCHMTHRRREESSILRSLKSAETFISDWKRMCRTFWRKRNNYLMHMISNLAVERAMASFSFFMAIVVVVVDVGPKCTRYERRRNECSVFIGFAVIHTKLSSINAEPPYSRHTKRYSLLFLRICG